MSLLSINFPIVLTLARLILSPLLLPILFIELLPLNSFQINFFLAVLFVALSLTDFFDGYFARKLRQETLLGRILDPIADKFLLYSTLVALVYVQKIYFFWAIIFIGREFLVMGLREVALSHGFSINVSNNAKLKTFFQMAYLTLVIFNPYQVLNLIMLSLALYYSVISAVQYYLLFLQKIRVKHEN